jgi:glycogen synthase
MRVLMTTTTMGGVWAYSIELARALQLQDVQIALATLGGPLDAWQREQVNLCRNVTLYDNPPAEADQAAAWLLEIESLFEPDVIHLNGSALGHRHFDAPVIVVGHSCELSRYRAIHGTLPPNWQAHREAVRRGLVDVELLVAPTHAMLASFQEFYGPLPRTQVIHHGLSSGRYQPAVKQNLILSVGQINDEAKNIAALEHIADKLPWQLWVLGEDRQIDEQAMAQRLSQAAIFTLPALYEPFGLTILEAAMSGCALVIGDTPSLRELWADAAVFVPGEDLSAIRDALEWLINAPEQRQRLSDAARERSARYNASAMAKAYLAAYRQLSESKWRSLTSDEPMVKVVPQPSIFSQQRIA